MTAFAVAADVVRALRRALTSTEGTYVDDVIAEAQDLVTAYLGCGADPYATEADVPGPVTRVTARMVARVFQQDDGRAIGTTQTQQTAGPFMQGTSFVSGATTGAPWLAASDKKTLAPYRCGGGMVSVQFNSERGYDCDDITDDDCDCDDDDS